MVNQQLVNGIASIEQEIVSTLFKPVQFNVIKKLSENKRLSENEKRYLRGNLSKKFNALQEIMELKPARNDISPILNSIGSYYITGLEALKHNGYGWFYEPKVIEVINTKIEGRLALKSRTIKLIRVKSISSSKTALDKETGLRYATNEQVMHDTSFTKNLYTQSLCKQMLARYGKMFAKKGRQSKARRQGV